MEMSGDPLREVLARLVIVWNNVNCLVSKDGIEFRDPFAFGPAAYCCCNVAETGQPIRVLLALDKIDCAGRW